MRLQVIDPTVKYDCQGCTRCCDQPWRTLIEADKLPAIDAVDWAAEYPSLAGRQLYRKQPGDQSLCELAKGEGTRCVFLDHDGLCIIHKKLGYDAKPQMCKQFPLFAALAWDADYVSASYGCKAVQQRAGRPLAAQTDTVAQTVPLHDKPTRPDAPFMLAREVMVPQDAAAALLEYLGEVFDGDGTATLVARLARALSAVEKAAGTEPERLLEAVRSGEIDAEPDPQRYEPFAAPGEAPMPSRFLFAATLFPDALPPDSSGDLGFFKRMTLVPRLMSLAQMRGAYASRLLGRTVRIDQVLTRAADLTVTPAARTLLGRYLRSRMWQRFPGGTQLPLASALHQHILDINAVMFFGAAECHEVDKDRLDLPVVQRALMLVEFHLSNQRRLYTQVLKNWLKGSLANPALAWASLRMIRTRELASLLSS